MGAVRPAAAASIAEQLDRGEAHRSRPLERALDLGCGRGQDTPELARCGWEAVGIDDVPRAVAAARRRSGGSGATFALGEVTDPGSAGLGTFDSFLDVGCLQGVSAEQRAAGGRVHPAREAVVAAPAATRAHHARPW